MRPVDETGGCVGSRLPCWLTAAGFLRGEGIFYYPITLGEGCRAGSGERRAESRERGAESREQGAGSRGQGAGSREQGAESREQVNLSHSRPNGWFLPELARKNPPSDLHIPVGHSCLRCLSAALRHYHSNGWFLPELARKNPPSDLHIPVGHFPVFAVCAPRFGIAIPTGGFCPNLPEKIPFRPSYSCRPSFCLRCLSGALRNNHANGWFLPELAQNKSSFRLSCSCRPFSCLRCLSAALRHYHSNGWFARTCSKRSSVPPSYSCRPFSCLRCLSGALRNNHANGWFCPNLPKTNPPSDFNVPVGHFPVFAVCPGTPE